MNTRKKFYVAFLVSNSIACSDCSRMWFVSNDGEEYLENERKVEIGGNTWLDECDEWGDMIATGMKLDDALRAASRASSLANFDGYSGRVAIFTRVRGKLVEVCRRGPNKGKPKGQTAKAGSRKSKAEIREDKIDAIADMIVKLCDKSFYDGGCVNDADLDEIKEKIREI